MDFANIILIIGWLIAIWQSIVVLRISKKSSLFQKRIEIYNNYFQKLDEINDKLSIDYQEYFGPFINNIYTKILENPDNSNSFLNELQQGLSSMFQKSMKTIQHSTQELQTLRFIASKKTLLILDEYKCLAESQTEIIGEIFSTIDIYSQNALEIAGNQKLIDVSTNLVQLKNKLESQMREDLGIK